MPKYHEAINLALAAEGPLSLAAVAMRVVAAESSSKQFDYKQARDYFTAADKALRELGGAHEIRANFRAALFAYFLWGYSAISSAEATEEILKYRARLVATTAPLPDWYLPTIDIRLGAIKIPSGDLAEGLPLFESSYKALKAAIGSDPNPRDYQATLGMGLMSVGRHAEADRALRQVLELTQAAGLGSHPYSAWIYHAVAMNLRHWGKLDEAQKFLDAVPKLESLRAGADTKDDRVKFIDWERAALEIDRGHPAQAIRILEAHPREGPDPDAISFYDDVLGEALCLTHRPAEGMPLLRQVQKINEDSAMLPFSPDYGELWASMGRCALAAGDRTNALAYASKARAVFAAQPGVEPYVKAPSQQLDRLLGIRNVAPKS
jgi:tetratricopeptide (TPR) repeat protein